MTNTNSPEYQRVRDKVAEKLHADTPSAPYWDKLPQSAKELWYPFADEILAIKGIAVLADEQSVPDRSIGVCANCWITTQQDMLNANFRRVV